MSKANDLLKQHEEFLYEKTAKYCAYQPRCSQEVLSKLKELGATEKSAEKILNDLQKENFLNDELFANSYAVGKNRNNKWGRIRISFELKRKGISEEIIYKALNSIDKEEYLATLLHLAEKKLDSLKEKDKNTVYQKVMAYVANKGYEKNLIYDVLNDLINKK